VARRSGNDWYLAAMTDWTARTLDVPLTFLPAGTYAATIVSDGMNADRYAADYRLDKQEVGPGTTLTLRLAPGGGYLAQFRRIH
jgi:alpha-glucosidase